MPRKLHEHLVEEVASGDRRRALEAARDRVARELETAEGRDVAPLTRALVQVLDKLAALSTGEEQSTVDDLAARREARRTASGP